MPKKIHHNSIINQQAIALIQRTVADMGFVFYESGGVEAGIDGTIEIRDTNTGEVTNCIIGVQSKGTSLDFVAETPTAFTYLCDERDLVYWLGGNVPVVLIVSRPETDEAYWVPLKNYFSNPQLRQARKVHFDKVRDRFEVSSKAALIDLALPRDAGFYFSPSPKIETVYSNLMIVSSFAPTIYTAYTGVGTPKEVWKALNETRSGIGSEWILTEGQIRSFYNLREYPWDQICDQGTVEGDPAEDWAYSDDENQKRDFVKLLNSSLTEMVKPDLIFYRDKRYHFFRDTDDLSDWPIAYQGLQKSTDRDVFKVYRNKKDTSRITYCRHMAFRHHFQRLDDQWYLEINPTYHYTRDGRNLSLFYEEKLQGIKRLERNNAVLGQIHFWSQYLRPTSSLFETKYPFLALGPLQKFELAVGINDKAWLPKEDADEAKALDAEEADDSALASVAGTLRLQL